MSGLKLVTYTYGVACFAIAFAMMFNDRPVQGAVIGALIFVGSLMLDLLRLRGTR